MSRCARSNEWEPTNAPKWNSNSNKTKQISQACTINKYKHKYEILQTNTYTIHVCIQSESLMTMDECVEKRIVVDREREIE